MKNTHEQTCFLENHFKTIYHVAGIMKGNLLHAENILMPFYYNCREVVLIT